MVGYCLQTHAEETEIYLIWKMIWEGSGFLIKGVKSSEQKQLRQINFEPHEKQLSKQHKLLQLLQINLKTEV